MQWKHVSKFGPYPLTGNRWAKGKTKRSKSLSKLLFWDWEMLIWAAQVYSFLITKWVQISQIPVPYLVHSIVFINGKSTFFYKAFSRPCHHLQMSQIQQVIHFFFFSQSKPVLIMGKAGTSFIQIRNKTVPPTIKTPVNKTSLKRSTFFLGHNISYYGVKKF